MNLYEVVFWGADGYDSEDTIYLVRASDWRAAVDHVECNASPDVHKIHRSTVAHRVYELGTDLSPYGEPIEMILRGPYFQCAHNHGWRAWKRELGDGGYSREWKEETVLPWLPIVEDDRSTVENLLKENPSLATEPIRTSTLYTTGIFHWIYKGDTALHLAAAGYRVEIIRLLLAAGADPNAATNHRHGTPLHYAADGFITGPAWDAKRQVATLRLLLKHGADIHAQDKNGATPLHRAVRTRCAAATKFLLQAGADPTLKNKPGSTPFHLAVQNTGRGGSGSPEAIAAQRAIIKTFLAHGVSPSLKDAKGKTVLASTKSDWIRQLLSLNVGR